MKYIQTMKSSKRLRPTVAVFEGKFVKTGSGTYIWSSPGRARQAITVSIIHQVMEYTYDDGRTYEERKAYAREVAESYQKRITYKTFYPEEHDLQEETPS